MKRLVLIQALAKGKLQLRFRCRACHADVSTDALAAFPQHCVYCKLYGRKALDVDIDRTISAWTRNSTRRCGTSPGATIQGLAAAPIFHAQKCGRRLRLCSTGSPSRIWYRDRGYLWLPSVTHAAQAARKKRDQVPARATANAYLNQSRLHPASPLHTYVRYPNPPQKFIC
jgi:hypothetical protein